MKKFLNILGCLISTILAISFFSIALSFLMIVSLENILSHESINKMIKSVDFPTIIHNLNEAEKEDLNNSLSVVGLTENNLIGLLDDDRIKDFASDYLYGMISYLKTGKEDDIITTQKYEKFINNHYDNIVSEYGLSFKDKSTTDVKKFLLTKETSNKVLSYQKDTINNIEKDVLDSIRTFYNSSWIKYYLMLSGFYILLFIVFRWSFYRWMKWMGIPIIIASIFPLLISVLQFTKLSISSFSNNTPVLVDRIISSVLPTVFYGFFMYGIIALFIGIGLVALQSVLKNRDNMGKPNDIIVDPSQNFMN